MTGISWYRWGTSHTIFTCLSLGMLWIPHSIGHFKVSYKNRINLGLQFNVTPIKDTLEVFNNLKTSNKNLFKKKTNFIAPFYWWGSSPALWLQPLQGGSFLFTTKFPEIPGTQICLFNTISCTFNTWYTEIKCKHEKNLP